MISNRLNRRQQHNDKVWHGIWQLWVAIYFDTVKKYMNIKVRRVSFILPSYISGFQWQNCSFCGKRKFFRNARRTCVNMKCARLTDYAALQNFFWLGKKLSESVLSVDRTRDENLSNNERKLPNKDTWNYWFVENFPRNWV